MSPVVDTGRTASFVDGEMIVHMDHVLEIRFPVARNPRLAAGTAAQLHNIEISPFGLRWPDLDEVSLVPRTD